MYMLLNIQQSSLKSLLITLSNGLIYHYIFYTYIDIIILKIIIGYHEIYIYLNRRFIMNLTLENLIIWFRISDY